MTIQAQNQLDSLLSELTNLPHGKVLSEFALARYLNQADKLLKIDAANAWHVSMHTATLFLSFTSDIISLRCSNL